MADSFLASFCDLANTFVDNQVLTRNKGSNYVPPSVAHPSKLEHLYGCSNCNYSEAGCRQCWDNPFATRPASRAKPHKGHYQRNLPDAPTFRPTAEQFRDPFAYLAHIAPEAQKAGIALIIPPKGWSPPIQMLDQETGLLHKDFKVPTRIQPTHLICKRYATPSGAPPSSASSSTPSTPRSCSLQDKEQQAKKSTAVTGRCSKASMDAQKAALAAAAAAAQAAEEGKEVILNPAHWDAIATAAEATDGQFGYEHLEDPLTLHDFHRYADWAKRRHFNGPLMSGCKPLRQLEATPANSSTSRPPVATASDAWRVYPSTAAARTARGITGKYVPGTCTPVPGRDVGDGSDWQEPSIEEVEAEFWRIVEAADEQVEALYGQDIDTATYNSAFPTIKELAQAEAKNLVKPPRKRGSQHNNDAPSIANNRAAGADSDDETASDPANCCSSCSCGSCQLCTLRAYTSHPWNINNLPQAKGSVLRFVREDVGGKPITGLMVPWVYVGSCFSAFCWHIEDHGLYSINYNHMGAPKVWYGVPATAAAALDAAMRDALPHLFEKDSLLLHKLITMLSPNQLTARGVPVCRAVQVPGSFIVTFPDAYHAGFNSGFNVAEAVNFAAPDWLPFGSSSVVRYRCESRYMTFSHDAMLINVVREAAAAHANSSSSCQLALPAPDSSCNLHEQQQKQQQAAGNGILLPESLQPPAAHALRAQFAAQLEQTAAANAEAEEAAAMEFWQHKQEQQAVTAAASDSFRRVVAPLAGPAVKQPGVVFSSSVVDSSFWWEAYSDASWSEAAQVVDEAEGRKLALIRQREFAKQLLAIVGGVKQLAGKAAGMAVPHQHHDLLHLKPEQEGVEHHLAAGSHQHHTQGQRERVFTMRGAIHDTVAAAAEEKNAGEEEYLGPAAGVAAAAAAAGPSAALIGRAARGLATAAFARKTPKIPAAAAATATVGGNNSSSSGAAGAGASVDPRGDAAVAAIMRYILALAEARRQRMLLKPPSPTLARLAVGELALRLELEGQRQQALLLQAGISRTAIMQGTAAAHDPATGVHINTQGVECATCGCDLSLAAVVSEQDPGRAVCPEHIADLDGTRSECYLLLRYMPGQLQQLLTEAVRLIPGAADAVAAARQRQGWVAAGRFMGSTVLQKPAGSTAAAAVQYDKLQQHTAVLVKQEAVEKQQQQKPVAIKVESNSNSHRQRLQQPVVEVKLLGKLYDPKELSSKLFEELDAAVSVEETDEDDDDFDEVYLQQQQQQQQGLAVQVMSAEDDEEPGTSGEVLAKQEGQHKHKDEHIEAEGEGEASGGDQSSGSWWKEELDGHEDAFGFYTFAAADAASSDEERAAAANSDDDFKPGRGRGRGRKRRRGGAAAAGRKRSAAVGPADAPVRAAPAAVAVDAAA